MAMRPRASWMRVSARAYVGRERWIGGESIHEEALEMLPFVSVDAAGSVVVAGVLPGEREQPVGKNYSGWGRWVCQTVKRTASTIRSSRIAAISSGW